MALNWLNRRSRNTQTPQPESLVLSGGGSRASFHIGALRYLYDQVNIKPDRIVGTSAGSIVAAIMAQSLDPQVQTEHLDELEQLWLTMDGPQEMYVEQAWFSRLRGQWADIAALLPADDKPTDKVIEATGDPMELVQHAMADDPSLDVNAGVTLLWRLLTALPRIGRAGAGLAASLQGAERASSAFRPGPIVSRLLFESTFQPERVASSGVRLRICFVDLNSGDLRYMREDGVIVDNDDRPIDNQRRDLTLGVWASCALPGVFRPVKIGNEVYVDGGVRQNTPVEMAVRNLGAVKPYVIAASPPGSDHAEFTNKDIVAVMLRVSSLSVDETIRNQIMLAQQAGAVIIQPRVDVHNALTVEPALLRINRDYGWTRAAEEVTKAPGSLRDINDAIVNARCEWAGLVKQDANADTAGLQARLTGLLAQADSTLLPPGHETWAEHLI